MCCDSQRRWLAVGGRVERCVVIASAGAKSGAPRPRHLAPSFWSRKIVALLSRCQGRCFKHTARPDGSPHRTTMRTRDICWVSQPAACGYVVHAKWALTLAAFLDAIHADHGSISAGSAIRITPKDELALGGADRVPSRPCRQGVCLRDEAACNEIGEGLLCPVG
jgi:hypothetical protein